MAELRDSMPHYQLLGEVGVSVDGADAPIGGARPRRLLAVLLLREGRVVTLDQIIEAVWGESAPAAAVDTLRTYVARLRKALAEAHVELAGDLKTVPNGYRIDCTLPTDATLFEKSLETAKRKTRANDHSGAVHELESGLALWTGPALAEFADEEWATSSATRLELLRVDAEEFRVESRLALGDGASVLADLEGLITSHPLREGFRKQRMLALHQSGRTTEALREFSAFSDFLADESGLEPSRELVELEDRILRGEVAVTGEPSPIRGYAVSNLLGTGPLGATHLATQPTLGREVSLKTTPPEIADDPAFVQAFDGEAQAIAGLAHPNIVPLIDAWREPGAAYQVSLYLRGASLAERLQQPMGGKDIVNLATDVCFALASAHQQGVSHGNIKPSNVLFDDADNAYLSDFGVLPAGMKPTGYVASYSQRYGAYGEEKSDPSADVYALGMVLLHAASGIAPTSIGEHDTAGAYVRHLRRASEIPDLLGVLEKATSPRRDRFRDGVELAEALESVLPIGEADHTSDGVQAPTELAQSGRSDSVDRAAKRVADQLAAETDRHHEQRAATNPFKGLLAFRERDAADFHGRDSVVDDLLKRLDEERFVAVVGPSGSGKSSVVRAGVVPRRRDDGHYILSIVPGPHPFDELETALSRLAPLGSGSLKPRFEADERGLLRTISSILPEDGRALLLVDQFEELFTMTDPEECARFLEALAAIASDPRSGINILITIRADFFDRPLSNASIGPLVRDHTAALTPMDVDELTDAIVLPLASAGVGIEPSTVSRLVSDLRGTSSANLPLLQYAMTQLFERHSNGHISAAEYEEIGGLAGALSRRADEILESLSADDQLATRRLFTRLITPGEGVEDTRRRVSLGKLPSVGSHIVDAFGEARLLSFDHDPLTREPTIEVAHEALIREWRQLRQWIEADRDALRALRHLSTAATGWVAHDRNQDELYRGGRLDTAIELNAEDSDSLTDLEQEFVDASVALRREQVDAERQQLTRLRRRLIGTACLLVVSLIAGVLALQQRERANDSAAQAQLAGRNAETRRLVAEAGLTTESNRRIGLLLAAEAARREPGNESLGALQRALVGIDNLLGFYGGSAQYRAVTFTGDGNLLAADDNGISLFDADTGATLLRIDQFGAEELILSTDGTTVAVATTNSTIHFFDLTTGSPNATPIRNGTDITTLAFSADEQQVVVGDREGRVRVYDRATGSIEVELDAHPEQGLSDVDAELLGENIALEVAHEPSTFLIGVTHLELSDDGRHLLTVGGVHVRLWDLGSGENLLSETVTRESLRSDGRAVSPPILTRWISSDQFDIVTAFEIQRWSVADAAPLSTTVLPDRTTGISLQRVSANTALAANLGVLVSADGAIAVFDGDGNPVRETFDSQLTGALAIAIREDERVIAIASDDGIGLFSLDGSRVIGAAVPAITGELTLNADATLLSVSSPFGDPPSLWDITDRKNPKLREQLDDGTQFAWAAGQEHLVTWSVDGVSVSIRNAASLEALFTVTPLTLFATAMDRAETRVALGLDNTIAEEAIVSVISIENGGIEVQLDDLAEITSNTLVRAVSFSNDGSRMVAATVDGAAMVWDTTTWEPVGPVISQGGGSVVQAAYSPNDEWLVTIAENGTIAFRDTETYQPTGPTFLGNNDAVAGFSYGPFFSEDGRFMITTADVFGRLWDIDSGEQIGGVFPSDPQSIPHVSRDGRTLAATIDGFAVLWDLDTTTWLDSACQAAGRNFTLAEWEQFGPTDEPYSLTCPQWPSELTEQEQQQTEQGANE